MNSLPVLKAYNAFAPLQNWVYANMEYRAHLLLPSPVQQKVAADCCVGCLLFCVELPL